MSSFIFFAYVWPVVGTMVFCAFGLFLARRDRVLYEQTRDEVARRQAERPAHTAAIMPRPEPITADA